MKENTRNTLTWNYLDGAKAYYYATTVPNAPSGVPQGERPNFFDQERCYRAMVVMVGPFGHPLGVVWLSGTVDCPLLGFFNLRVGVQGP